MPAGLEEALPSKTPAETISRWEMLRILTKARERSSHPDEEPAAGKLPAFDGLNLDGPVDASTIEKLNVALYALAQEQQLQQESLIKEPRPQANAPSRLRSLMLPLAVAQAEHNDAMDLASGELHPDLLFVEPAALKRSASAPSARKGHTRSRRSAASNAKFGQEKVAEKMSQMANAAAQMDPRNPNDGRNRVTTDSSLSKPTQQGAHTTVFRAAKEHTGSPTKGQADGFHGPSAAHGTSPPGSTGARDPTPELLGFDARQGQQKRAGGFPSQRLLPRGNRTFDSVQTPTQTPTKGSPQERMSPTTNPPAFERSPERAGARHVPGDKRQQEPGPLNKRWSGDKIKNQPLRDPQEKDKTGRLPSSQNLRAPASHGTQDSAGYVKPSASSTLPPDSNLPSNPLGLVKGQYGRHQGMPPESLSFQPGSKPTGRPAVSGSQPSTAETTVSDGSRDIQDQRRPMAPGVISAPTGSRTISKPDGSSGSPLRHLQTSVPSQAATRPARQTVPLQSSFSQKSTAPGIGPKQDLLAAHQASSQTSPQPRAAPSKQRSEKTTFRPSLPAAGRIIPGLTAGPSQESPQRAGLATPLRDSQHSGPTAGIQSPAAKARELEIRMTGKTPPTAPGSHQRIPQDESAIERNPSAPPERNKQPTHSLPQRPKDCNSPSAHGTTDLRDGQGDENIEANLPSTSVELVEGDFTADEMFELFLTGQFPRDLSSQVNSFSILQRKC